MKIKRIELYNIGPYVGKNVFDLSIKKKKNIVLIGGKNGAGKTTFFKSIKTGLYGCRVWGFDAPGKEYFNIVSTLVNTNTQYNNDLKAYIEIDLFFDDGKQQTIYTLHREWCKEKKGFVEYFSIEKNGIKLNEEEMFDFNNYMLSLIPPDMFNFYFFDGESIADYFLGNDGKNFRNAFLKLYGLDTLSLMVENFERYFKKKNGNDSFYADYIEAKKSLENAEERNLTLKDELKKLEETLDLEQIKLQSLQKSYTKEGGVSFEEWKDLNNQLIKEETTRDEVNRWLKEIANHYLPFLILQDKMQQLKNLLIQEEENLKSNFVKEMVSKEEFVKKLDDYLNQEGCKIDSNNIVKFICDSISVDNKKERLFDLSSNQLRKIQAQIDEKTEFDKNDILKAIKLLNTSLSKSKKIRDKLTKSSIDGLGNFTSEKDAIEKQIMSLNLEIERKNTEIAMSNQELENKNNCFEKAKQNYESLLKSKSINEMSSRAVAAYTLLEDKLITKQSKILQEEFYNCFSSIINKDNFLDGIVVDKNINIIPYKLIDVGYSQIDNYMEVNSKTKFLDLFDRKYLVDVNNLRLGTVDSIKLPSPITAPFSQGERQVFIMSLYLALLKTSRKDIPFFIDTPFARIDSNHRSKIVSNFFLGINNQIIVLSTDEELVGKYFKQIENNISNKFLLKITGYGQTSILINEYFGE